MLCPGSLAASVSAAAIAFAKDKSDEQLALFASVFTQLGDTLSTIAAARQMCGSGSYSANNNGNIENPPQNEATAN